jgi:hypothetical protein
MTAVKMIPARREVLMARRIIFIHVAQFLACHRPVQDTLERAD